MDPKRCESRNKVRRKTKIIATVGPASRTPERLKELVMAGVDVFRLNFSHGTYDEHLETLTNIRAISDALKTPVAVLQDLCGPKIRITAVDDTKVLLTDGKEVLLKRADGSVSGNETIFVETLDPARVLKPGERILLADGVMELQVETVEGDTVRCRIIKGGKLRSKVGIAFPDSKYEVSAATKKDFSDLAWGIQHGVDYVAESFVSNRDDVLRLREKMQEAGVNIPIIAKIERRQAIENIESIISVVDGIMVARGDLGVEVPLEQVPLIQKMLIERSNKAGIPVIVATQMMSSMVTSIRPTRAEVSDIATAVLSGTDAVMLSEETAIGENPGECARYLSKIAKEAEQHFDYDAYQQRVKSAEKETIADAIAYAARAAASKLGACVIISGTESGRTARLIAHYRPEQPIFGSSYKVEACRRMCLYWGVSPILVPAAEDIRSELMSALDTVRQVEQIEAGETAVMTAGQSVRKTGGTSLMTVHQF